MQNPQSDHKTILEELKQEQIAKIKQRHTDKILEKENAEFLIKLIENAESKEEVLKLSALGMSLKRTGFHFDVRLEKSDRTIKYFVKNEKLSFESTNGKSHTLIIGDNYPALLNLLINYKRKVKVIYIDPPYGKDDLGEFAQTNYDNAITRDNLLSMLYPRLSLAKMLLQDDGVIFCSIDDRNQAYVKGLFDEVFGEGNFVANFIWNHKYTTSNDTDVSNQHEYILCYSKERVNFTLGLLPRTEKQNKSYKNRDNDPKGAWKATPLHAKGGSENSNYTITFPNGFVWKAPAGRHPRYSKENILELYNNGELYFNANGGVDRKTYLSEVRQGVTCGTMWHYDEVGHSHSNNEELADILGKGVFSDPKGTKLLKKIIKISTTNPSDYVDLQVDSMDYDNATTTGGGGQTRRIA